MAFLDNAAGVLSGIGNVVGGVTNVADGVSRLFGGDGVNGVGTGQGLIGEVEDSYTENFRLQADLNELTMDYQLAVESMRTIASIVEDLVDTSTEARKDAEESVG